MDNVSSEQYDKAFKELEPDLYNGEGPECLGPIEAYYSHRQVMFDMLGSVLRGEGESVAANEKRLFETLQLTAKGYADAVQAIAMHNDGKEDLTAVATRLFADSWDEAQKCVTQFSQTEITIAANFESAYEAIGGLLDTDSDEEQRVALERTYGECLQGILTVVVEFAPDNKNEVRKAKMQQHKETLQKASMNIAQIAIGTGLGIAVNRLFRRK